jgi:cell division inhibitor SulA
MLKEFFREDVHPGKQLTPEKGVSQIWSQRSGLGKNRKVLDSQMDTDSPVFAIHLPFPHSVAYSLF